MLLFCSVPFLLLGKITMTIPETGKYSSSFFLDTLQSVQEYPLADFSLDFGEKAVCAVITTRFEKGDDPVFYGKTDDDTEMFRGETAEIFLAPEPESGIYYHFAVNPSGICYSAKKLDHSWTPDFPRPEIIRHENFWQVKFIIPYRAINTTCPQADTLWKANFAVSKHRSKSFRHALNWSGANNYHNISQFGSVKFGKTPEATLNHCAVKNGTLEIRLENPGNSRIFCEYNGFCTEYFTPEIKIPLKKDYLELKPDIPFTIFLTGKNGKKLKEWKLSVKLDSSKNFTLNRFYALPKETVRYTHSFGADAVLKIFDSTCQLLKTVFPVPPQGTLPLDGITEKHLIIELSDKNVRCSRLLLITDKKLPALADNGKLTVDGKFFRYNDEPVFLISSGGARKRHLHKLEAFNFKAGGYGAQKNAVFLQTFPGKKIIRKPTVGYLFYPDWEKLFEKVLKKPSVNTIYRINYEAQLDVYLSGQGNKMIKTPQVEFYRQLYRNLKTCYPEKLFSIHCDRSTVLSDYVDSGDILEGAFWTSSFAQNIMTNLLHDLKQMYFVSGTKPAIFWLGGTIPNNKCRTAEELRAGVFAAMFNDMAGVIFHMGHDGLPENRERLWSLISGINAEVQFWYPSFRKGRKLTGFVKHCENNFYHISWEYNGKIHVGVINFSGGENFLQMRTLKGEIKALFTPFEVKIFTF